MSVKNKPILGSNCKIHLLNGYIQTIYLVEQQGQFLLLDGCARPDVKVVEDYIENQLQKKFSDLKLVISTHAHPDHAGGLSYFKQKGIAIAGPAQLNTWYSGVSGLMTYLVDLALTYLVAVNKKRGLKNILFPRKIALDIVLGHEQKVPGFENWQVLVCSGHTSMDLSIYNKDNQLIYVADNFVGSAKKLFRPYPLYSPINYIKSLQLYKSLNIQKYMLAHYGVVEIPQETLQELIDSTPKTSRRHTNTLPKILLKLLKALIKK